MDRMYPLVLLAMMIGTIALGGWLEMAIPI